MNYLLFSFLKTLYFCYNSMVFLSIYNILYTIEKLWFPSFQWDCCQSEILTYFLSSQLSIQISYLSPVQPVLFKILEYSRQCKIPHSKAYALLLRTDNQESCFATLGPHLYYHTFQMLTFDVLVILLCTFIPFDFIHMLNFDVLVMFLCPFIPFDFIYGLCSTQLRTL